MKSLKEFIASTQGKFIDVPWGFKGQCVSLTQRYLNECFGYVLKARGNAKDWSYSLVNEGIGTKVSSPKYGDIIVWGSNYGGGYGHIAIYIDKNTIYDQNNRQGGRNGSAVYGVMLPHSIAYIRLKKALQPDTKAKTEQEHKNVANVIWTTKHNYGTGSTRKQRLEAEGYDFLKVQGYIDELANPSVIPSKPTQAKKEYVRLSKAVTKGWRVYPLGKEPITKNAIGKLQPNKFGGLEYEILDRPMSNVVTIQTRDFGKVNIWIGAGTAHEIVRK